MLLALCEGNPSATGGFPSQRPVMQNFEVFFDLHLNKRLSKQLSFKMEIHENLVNAYSSWGIHDPFMLIYTAFVYPTKNTYNRNN